MSIICLWGLSGIFSFAPMIKSNLSDTVTALAAAINSSILQWSASADTSANKVLLEAPYIDPEFAVEVAIFPVGDAGINSWGYVSQKSQRMTVSAVRFPYASNDFAGDT